MSTIEIEYSYVIAAAPETIYSILTDYHKAHPAILPKQFTKLTVVEGGTGAGTIYDLEMEVMGVASGNRMAVTEPDPGRVLVEKDLDGAVTTTFTVDPVEGGQKSRVTIHSAFRASPGLKGIVERLLQPLIVRRMYKEELRNLAAHVAK